MKSVSVRPGRLPPRTTSMTSCCAPDAAPDDPLSVARLDLPLTAGWEASTTVPPEPLAPEKVDLVHREAEALALP